MSSFRRFLLVTAMVILTILSILAIVYQVYNQRWARELEAARREMQAKDESLAWASFVPPPVPDDQNLALSPFYQRALHYGRDPKTGAYVIGARSTWPAEMQYMPLAESYPKGIPYRSRDLIQRTDFAAYAAYYQKNTAYPPPTVPGDPAAAVLTALGRYAPALDELAHAAAEYPRTRFPVAWNSENPLTVRLPHYILSQNLASTLALRASAHLAVNQPAEALSDIELGLRLCRDLETEPTLLSHLIESVSLRALLTPVWEGLADRRWSGEQLTHLQTDLHGVDLLASYQHVMRGERTTYVDKGIDYMATHLGELPDMLPFGTTYPPGSHSTQSKALQTFGRAAPQGWFDGNKALIIRLLQRYAVEGVDPATHRADPARLGGLDAALGRTPSAPTNLLARIMLPVFTSVAQRSVRTQAMLDTAAAASALERFYLDRQAYPTTLAELTSGYVDRLPTDLIDGAALRYGPTPDGRYRLYSVGWNQADDGGQVVWEKDRVDGRRGDWVWQYQPLQPPTR